MESRSVFAPKTAMCRDAQGNLLTDEREVIEAWKCHFEDHHISSTAVTTASELFKMGPERRTVEKNQLIVKIWEQEELPEE